MYTKNTEKVDYIALVFFILCWIILTFSMKTVDNINTITYILKFNSLYIASTLAIIIFFKDFRHIQRFAKSIPFFKIEKLLTVFKKVINKILKKKVECQDANNIDQIVKETSTDNKKDTSNQNGLHKIKYNNRIEDEIKGLSFDKGKFFYYVSYVLLQCLNSYWFIYIIFSDTFFTLNLSNYYIMLSLFVILSICAFTIRKFALSRSAAKRNTVAGFTAYFGTLLFATTIFYIVQVMFSLDYIEWLLKIFKIAGIYLVASIFLNIIMSFFKKEAAKFDYEIYIPIVNGKAYSIKSLLNIFEENTKISIKSLWSIKYLVTVFPAFILSIIMILFSATCVYKVEPYQEGAIYRLGRLDEKSIKSSGLHIKYPWPLEKLEIYDTKRERNLQIGYKTTSAGDFLWAVPHEGGEYTLVLGNGNELVAINAKVNYCIGDLYLYLSNYQNPEALLSDTAYELLTKKTVTKTLNNFLMEDRTRLSEELKNELALYCTENNLGLAVKNVVIQSIHPAVEVADVYQGVVGAGIEKKSRITKAEAEASRLIAVAEEQKEKFILEAIQNQAEKLALAKYELEVYEAAFYANKKNPSSFKLDKYLNTYEKIISENKLYIFSEKASININNYVINKGGKENQAVIIN